MEETLGRIADALEQVCIDLHRLANMFEEARSIPALRSEREGLIESYNPDICMHPNVQDVSAFGTARQDMCMSCGTTWTETSTDA